MFYPLLIFYNLYHVKPRVTVINHEIIRSRNNTDTMSKAEDIGEAVIGYVKYK